MSNYQYSNNIFHTDFFDFDDSKKLIEVPELRADQPNRNCLCKGPACVCCVDFNITIVDLGGPGKEVKFITKKLWFVLIRSVYLVLSFDTFSVTFRFVLILKTWRKRLQPLWSIFNVFRRTDLYIYIAYINISQNCRPAA